MQIRYETLDAVHFERFLTLANQVHGDNYMDEAALRLYVPRSWKEGVNASFVALDGDKIVGLRLTFAANQWPLDKWCTPQKWPVPQQDVAYFKVIAIDPDYQGYGIGGQLLKRSISALKQQGAKAGLAHVWEQSPGNNAVGYFTACGGELIQRHPNRWLQNCIEDGYLCPICGSDCDCVAAEMMIRFEP